MRFVGCSMVLAALGTLASACAQEGSVAGRTRTCETVAELPPGVELEPVGGFGRWSMSATPGTMTCSEPVGEAFGCVFAGPATVRVSSAAPAEEHTFLVAEGEMAAISINDGAVSCSPRSAQ